MLWAPVKKLILRHCDGESAVNYFALFGLKSLFESPYCANDIILSVM